MNAKTLVTEARSQTPNRRIPTDERKVADVSHLSADEVTAYVRDSTDRDVHFERKGGRTFVVADE